MPHNYDYNTAQELLSWAKNMLQTKSFPEVPLQLNKSCRILDFTHYLDSMISVISKHYENPTFHTIIEQLFEFREKIENQGIPDKS